MPDSLRLLMLEDSIDDVGLIKRVLNKSDLPLEIHRVGTGGEFIKALDSFSPQVILSDHKIPGFSSLEALVASREKFPFIPFILVTGEFPDERDVVSIIVAGADDYILKNNLVRLPTAIKQAIQKKETEKSLFRTKAERKNLEKEKQIAHNRLLFHVENAPLGFIEWDAQTRIKLWSKQAEEIFGWTEKEVRENGMQGVLQVYDEDLPWVSEVLGQLTSGKLMSNQIQHRNVRKDGRVIWCEWFNSVQKDPSGTVVTIMSLVRDITDEKNAKLQKEFDQRNLEALINNTSDLMWSVDRDMKLITSNQAFSETVVAMSGHPISKGGDVLGIGFTEEEIVRYKSFYQRAFSGESFTEVDHNVAPVENWSELSFYPIRAAGEVVGTACFSRDITGKVIAEQETVAREQRFRALFENSSDAIVLSDEAFGLLYQSPSVKRILGYSPEERLNKKLADYVHPDYRGYYSHLQKQVADNPSVPIPFQYRLLHHDGYYIWIEGVITNLLQDPSVKALVANYRDVTERKEADTNLELTLRRFEAAQKIAHLGHWQVNFATQETYWSDEAFSIFGMVPGSVIPSQDLFLQHVHPDDYERVKSIVEHSMNTLQPFSVFHRIKWANGKVRSLLSVGQFEFDDSDNPTGIYGISQDITELTEKESELEYANQELETFIYKTHHDLRAPIATIQGIVNLAASEITDKKAREFFSLVSHTVNKQKALLLSLSEAMTIRTQEPVIGHFKFSVVLDGVLDELKKLPEFTKVEVTRCDTLEIQFHTDRTLLHLALYHLLENAILYQGPGSAKPLIKLMCNALGADTVVIDIEDNGIGIPEAIHDKIFDMFYRGNEISKGSGLGLYLVKNAIDKLGGTIEVLSKKENGSIFRLTIPLELNASLAKTLPEIALV